MFAWGLGKESEKVKMKAMVTVIGMVTVTGLGSFWASGNTCDRPNI